MKIKEQLQKLSESTAAKVVASIVIPGGFIVWGAYEIRRRLKNRRHRKSKSSVPADQHSNDNWDNK